MPICPPKYVKNASLLMLVALAWNASAAPATSEELSATSPSKPTAESTGSSSSTPIAPPAATSPVTQSKTVDLLLQMQDQPQAMREGTSKPMLKLPKAEQAASEPANPMAELKGVLLSTGVIKQNDNADPASQQRAARDSERVAAGAPAGAVAATSYSEPRSSILNNPIIRFIRENRMLMAGVCALILVAVWGAASFSMRRSR